MVRLDPKKYKNISYVNTSNLKATPFGVLEKNGNIRPLTKEERKSGKYDYNPSDYNKKNKNQIRYADKVDLTHPNATEDEKAIIRANRKMFGDSALSRMTESELKEDLRLRKKEEGRRMSGAIESMDGLNDPMLNIFLLGTLASKAFTRQVAINLMKPQNVKQIFSRMTPWQKAMALENSVELGIDVGNGDFSPNFWADALSFATPLYRGMTHSKHPFQLYKYLGVPSQWQDGIGKGISGYNYLFNKENK